MRAAPAQGARRAAAVALLRVGRRSTGGAESSALDRVTAVVLTLLIGGLVAFQAPANALLARIVSDLGAAFVSLALSTSIVGVLLVAVGDLSELGGISGFKPEYLLGGISGAAIVAVSLITVRIVLLLGGTVLMTTR